MIDKTKLTYNIGDIIEVIIQGSTYRATIIAYCFCNHFNDYTRFYGYSVIVHADNFGGHSCSHMSYDYNGNTVKIQSNKGWYITSEQSKLIKAVKASVFKLLKI